MSITAVEAAIVARLVERLKVPGIVREVYSHTDYADISESVMATPSVAVIYQGYNPGTRLPGGAIQSVAFSFLVVVNVRNATNTNRGQGQRLDASPIIDATMEALLGFRTVPKFQPLQLEPAPGAAVSDAGFGYYPLAFSTTATYRAT